MGEWQNGRLGDFITLKRGYDLRTADRNEYGNVPIISSSGLMTYHTEAKAEPPGVVTGRYGSVGEFFYIDEPYWPLNTTLYVKDFKGNNPFFIYYYLQILNFKKFSDKTSIPGVNRNDLHRIKVSIPPVSEQRAIAVILGTWDEAIRLVEALIAALSERKRGLMQRLLTGEVRFPGYEGEWEEVRLGEVLHEVRRRVQEVDEKTYDLLSVRRRSEGIFYRETRRGDELSQTVFEVKEGDFLISKRQIVHGASSLVSEEFDNFVVSNAYHVLRAREGFDIRYFNWLSKTPYLYHLSYVASHGIHIEKLFFTIDAYLKQTSVMPPTNGEQEIIADILDSVEAYSSRLTEYAFVLSEQKKGLMQRLLTGEVRVGDVG